MTEPRFVSVAVDAPGVSGGRLFTYRVPESLTDMRLGEAVIVEYGRRRAVGVVLDEAARPDMAVKPLLARVRSDGPLLDELTRQRQEGQGRMATSLARAGALRLGLRARDAADLIHALASPELYRLLVIDRQWSSDRFERWLSEAPADQLPSEEPRADSR